MIITVLNMEGFYIDYIHLGIFKSNMPYFNLVTKLAFCKVYYSFKLGMVGILSIKSTQDYI